MSDLEFRPRNPAATPETFATFAGSIPVGDERAEVWASYWDWLHEWFATRAATVATLGTAALAAWEARQPEVESLKAKLAQADEIRLMLAEERDAWRARATELEDRHRLDESAVQAATGRLKQVLREVEDHWPDRGDQIALDIREALGLCTTWKCENHSQRDPYAEGFCAECLS